MNKIRNIIAKEIVDSRGNPTVEVELETNNPHASGLFMASVPSGASTGENEALELRDKDGKGVKKAIENVNKIIGPQIKGKNPENQKEIDDFLIELDGTENKSRLGANAILGVSMAVCRAGAAAKKVALYVHIRDLSVIPGLTRNPEAQQGARTLDSRFRGNDTGHNFKIPLPMFNLFEGGVHTNRETGMNVQEFMIVPHEKTMAENLILCNKVFQNLKENLEKNYGKVEMGFEGGFESPFSKTEQALYAFRSAVGKEDVKIALDVAASEFYREGKYNFEGRELTRNELLNIYDDFVKNFPIISIEDPFSEEDWNGFENIMSSSVVRTTGLLVIGDDLTTTNIKRIKEARNKLACNGVILKLNQIGTVTETIEASNLAKAFGWKTIVSHRSGETMDDFIADLAVGTGADFIKSGSPAKEERMVKYKRLIKIEQEIK